MDVSLSDRIIFVEVEGLWDTTTLLVLGVIPAKPGHPKPTREELALIKPGAGEPETIDLPLAGLVLKYTAIEFAMTVLNDEVGTVTVNISRDNDPLNPDGTRAIAKSLALTRAAGDSDFVSKGLVITGVAP